MSVGPVAPLSTTGLTGIVCRCFGHVVQLGTVDFMSEVTQVGLVASKQAIWDYDPEAVESAINGGLDAIAVIRTLAVKVSFFVISLDFLDRLMGAFSCHGGRAHQDVETLPRYPAPCWL